MYMTIEFYKLLIAALHYLYFSSPPPGLWVAKISQTTLLQHTSWPNDFLQMLNFQQRDEIAP